MNKAYFKARNKVRLRFVFLTSLTGCRAVAAGAEIFEAAAGATEYSVFRSLGSLPIHHSFHNFIHFDRPASIVQATGFQVLC